MFELTAVNYVEDTDTAPFISHSAVVIALTYGCKLYAGSNVIPENGLIDKLWFIDNRLKGKVINNILNEIKPLVSEILKNYSEMYNSEEMRWEHVPVDEHKYYSLCHDIENIVSKYERDKNNLVSKYELYRNNIVTTIHYYDFIDGSEFPPEFRDFIDNGNLLDEYGVIFYESSEDIYKKLTEELADEIYDNSKSYDFASDIITSTYSKYKNEGYVNEFWDDLIPKLLDFDYDNIYTVSGKNIYYDEQLIDL